MLSVQDQEPEEDGERFAEEAAVEHVPHKLALLESQKPRNFFVILVNSVDLYKEFLEMDGVD